MPTYEYRCKDCGHQLETVQAFSDDALTTCPVCHTEALRKVFGSVGISFKGSGFYKNDSRSKTSSAAGSSSASSSSTSSEGGASSTSTSTGSSGKDAGSSSSDSSSSSTTSSPAPKPASSSDAKSA